MLKIVVPIVLAALFGASVWIFWLSGERSGTVRGIVPSTSQNTEASEPKGDGGSNLESPVLEPLESVPLPDPEPVNRTSSEISASGIDIAAFSRRGQLWDGLNERFGDSLSTTIQRLTSEELQEKLIADLADSRDPRVSAIAQTVFEHSRLSAKVRKAHNKVASEYGQAELAAGRFTQPSADGAFHHPPFSEHCSVSTHQGTVILTRGYSPEYDEALRRRDDELQAVREALRLAILSQLER